MVMVLFLVFSLFACRRTDDDFGVYVEEKEGHLASRIDEGDDWLKVLDLALLSEPGEERPGEIDQDADHVLWRLDEEDEYSPLIANAALIALHEGAFDPEEARLRLNEGGFEWFYEEKEAWILLFRLDMVHEAYVVRASKDALDPDGYTTLPPRIPLLETFGHYDRYEDIEQYARYEDYDEESGLYLAYSYVEEHIVEGSLANIEGECLYFSPRGDRQVCHEGQIMEIRITHDYGTAYFDNGKDLDWSAYAGGTLAIDVEKIAADAKITFRLAGGGPSIGTVTSTGVHTFAIEPGFAGALHMDMQGAEDDEIHLAGMWLEGAEGETQADVPAADWRLLSGNARVSLPDAVGIWVHFTYDDYGRFFAADSQNEKYEGTDVPYVFFGTFAGWVLMADENIEEAILPEGLEEIGAFAFSRALHLEHVHLPESLRIIRRGAFYNVAPEPVGKLKEIVVPEGVHTIEDGAFQNVLLETVILPDQVENMGPRVFKRSGIETVDLPANLEYVPWRMFRFSALRTLTLHENIGEIQEGAFANTPDFETLVILHPDVVTMRFGAFDNTNEGLEIYVPDELVEDYKTHSQWLAMTDHIRPLSEHEAE